MHWHRGEGQGVHVAVYTMVPKPSVPNAFLAGTSEQLASLQAEALVDFRLKLGEVRSLSELKTLGVEPMAGAFARTSARLRSLCSLRPRWSEGRSAAVAPHRTRVKALDLPLPQQVYLEAKR